MHKSNNQRQKTKEGESPILLVRSCCAGVATGDGRHTAVRLRLTYLDDGPAIRCASVLRTPSAPSGAGRYAPTAPLYSGPNSVGPRPASVRLWTPRAAPYFAWGHPRAPRGNVCPAGSPATPPSRSPFPRPWAAPLDPSDARRPVPGPRLRRPAHAPTSDQGLRTLWNPAINTHYSANLI